MSTLILYSFLIFGTTVGGGFIPLLIPDKHEDALKLFISLGAGLLIGMAFLHLIPEAAELAPQVFGLWALVGFVLLLALERFFMVHACEEHGCNYHTVGMAAFAGLAIHGVIEGCALGSSQLATGLGPFIFLAILVHKAPSAFALASILKLAGRTKRGITLFLMGVGLSVPIGMWIAYALLQSEKLPMTAGILLSMSAGTFIYIGACDLLPELHRTDKDKVLRLGAFGVGLLCSFLSGYIAG